MAVLIGVAVNWNVAAASASPSLVASTIKVASRRAAGVISVKVAAFKQGVVKAMFVTKIKSVLAVVLMTVALCGATGLIYRTQADEPPQGVRASKEDQVKEHGLQEYGQQLAPQKENEEENLHGKWLIVSRTHDGAEQKYEAKDEQVMTFKKSSLLHSEPKRKAHLRFRLDETKSPKTLDAIELVGEDLFDLTDLSDLDKRLNQRLDECKERTQGIYLIDGNTLKLCICDKPGERPSDFEGNKGSNNILYILKRAK